MLKNCLYILLVFCSIAASAADTYEIKVKMSNYKEEILYLGYHYGDKQYLRDSATVKDKDGFFVFKGDSLLDKGIYLIVLAPDKKYFQFIIDDNSQKFTIEADAVQPDKDIKFKTSPQNALFYEYMHYLSDAKKRADAVREVIDSTSEASKTEGEEKLKVINNEVKEYQNNIVKKHPDYLLSSIIQSNFEIEIPTDFTGTEEEIAYKRFYYQRDHFFDNMNMKDGRLIRTPVMFQKVDAYVNKFHAIVPDSSILAVEKVLTMLKGNDDAFKFFLAHFLNTYSKSKYVGMDAVYVYLVDNYYAKGFAPWVEEESMGKIVKTANTLRPILLGKKAPELLMQDKDGKNVSLHGLDAKITVMIFWAPDCGHCQKSMPDVDKFAVDFKDRGVKVFSVCGKLGDTAECWKMIEDKGLQNLINVTDAKYRTRFKELYDVQVTPKIYLLDKDKIIISKNIGSEQLPEIVDRFLKEMETSKM